MKKADMKTERIGDFHRLHDELMLKTGKSLFDWKSRRDKRVGFFCKSSAPSFVKKIVQECERLRLEINSL